MRIILGADHRGYALKEEIKKHLLTHDHVVQDVAEDQPDDSDDYPDFASEVAHEVQMDIPSRGIIVCGSGVGVCITANKVTGIRCGFGMTKEQVQAAREDDDINMLALASDFLSAEDAVAMVNAFLDTEFEATENHIRRIEKISKIEKSNNVHLS